MSFLPCSFLLGNGRKTKTSWTSRLKNHVVGLPLWLSGKESAWQCKRWVRSLVWEDPACCGSTKPVSHSCWAPVPQLLKPEYSRACALQQEKPPHWEAHALQLALPLLSTTRGKPVQQQRPSPAVKKKINKNLKKLRKPKTNPNSYCLWPCVEQNVSALCVLWLFPVWFTKARLWIRY